MASSLVLCVFTASVSGGGPSAVSVSEETAVSLMVSWTPPNAHVLQYRVTYAALTGAEGHDNTVSTQGHTHLLPVTQGILSHTEQLQESFAAKKRKKKLLSSSHLSLWCAGVGPR